MTDAEQIDTLRREVADLRERVARLEAKHPPNWQYPYQPAPHPVVPVTTPVSPLFPWQPMGPATCKSGSSNTKALEGVWLMSGGGRVS